MEMEMEMEGASAGGLQTEQQSLPMRVEVDVRAATRRLVLLHPTVATRPTMAALLHDTTATQPPAALWTTLQTLLLQVRVSPHPHPARSERWYAPDPGTVIVR